MLLDKTRLNKVIDAYTAYTNLDRQHGEERIQQQNGQVCMLGLAIGLGLREERNIMHASLFVCTMSHSREDSNAPKR